MVAKYYVAVRPRTNENHAVHKEGCPFLPDDEKRIYLGMFNSEQDAVREGKRHFSATKGCLFCSKEHKVHDEKTSKYKLAQKDSIPERLHIPISFHSNLVCCLN